MVLNCNWEVSKGYAASNLEHCLRLPGLYKNKNMLFRLLLTKNGGTVESTAYFRVSSDIGFQHIVAAKPAAAVVSS